MTLFNLHHYMDLMGASLLDTRETGWTYQTACIQVLPGLPKDTRNVGVTRFRV